MIILFSIIALSAQSKLVLFYSGDDFTLTDLDNLDLWIDYDDSTPETSELTTNGSDEITAITDISGNSRTISITANPIDSSSSGIYFSGDDDFTIDAIATNYSGDDKPHSFVAVLKVTDLTTTRTIAGIGLASSNNAFDYLNMNSTPNYSNRRKDNAGTGDKTITAGTPTISAYVIIVKVFTGTSVSLYVNGSQIGSATDLDVGTTTQDTFTIGALRRTTTIQPYLGLMKAFAVFTRAITEAERASIESYYGY